MTRAGDAHLRADDRPGDSAGARAVARRLLGLDRVDRAQQHEPAARHDALGDRGLRRADRVLERLLAAPGLGLGRDADAERALEAPTRTIADNSGYDDGVVVERIRAGTGTQGFDAARGVYCDLVEAGIIDPTKVVRTALENAVSVAGLLLLSEVTMTEPPEPPKQDHERMEP